MRRSSSLFALLVLAAAACGGGPKLTSLRCRAVPCQDAEDPFKLLLSVDFDDPSGTLGAGALELRLDGKTQNAMALKDVFAAQGLDVKATKGTIKLDQDLFLDRVTQNKAFKSSVIATSGEGQQSNEPTLGFTLKVGGSPGVRADGEDP